MQVTIYNNITDTKSTNITTITKFLGSIKSGEAAPQINTIRDFVATNNMVVVKQLKTALQCITTSGTFAVRNDKGLLVHSGYVQIDIDKVSNVIDTKALLANDPYTFAAFISPTGQGVKVIVKIDGNVHNETYIALMEYYKATYSIKIDSSCKSVSKAMFISYDAKLYYNAKSKIFTISTTGTEATLLVEQPKATTNKPQSTNTLPKPNTSQISHPKANEVERLIAQLERQNIDITDNYKEWVRIGFALCNQFGANGLSYYHQISKCNANYEYNNCTTQYNKCLKGENGKVKISTLFAIAKNYNVLAYNGTTTAGAERPKAARATAQAPTEPTESTNNGTTTAGAERPKAVRATADGPALPMANNNLGPGPATTTTEPGEPTEPGKATKPKKVNTARINQILEKIIFYYPITKTDMEGNEVVNDCGIDYVEFNNLLLSFGFRRYDVGIESWFIHIENKVIKFVTIAQIQDYFISYLDKLPPTLNKGVTKKILLQKMYKNIGLYFCERRLSLLKHNEPILFNEDTKNECYIYYNNGYVKVTKQGYQLCNYNTLQGYIWDNQILKRDFKYIEVDGIKPKELGNYAMFLYNVCNGDLKRFYSLQTIIGYLLHSNMECKRKAIILTDSTISNEDNGRTGKSLLGLSLSKLKNSTIINGRDFDYTNRYKYQSVNLDTQLINLNDVKKRFPFETLYNDITDGINVEKKNQQPFKVFCKFCITTNKTISIMGDSAKDRCIEFEFSNYYSALKSPLEEFGQTFFSTDWNSTEWNKFDNILLWCIRLYLEYGIEIPKNENLDKRKLLENTNIDFLDFIEDCFISKKIVLGEEFVQKDLYNDFLNLYEEYKDGKSKVDITIFAKWLKTFAVFSHNINSEILTRRTAVKRFMTLIPIQQI